MIVPQKSYCDFCKEPIVEGAAWCKVSVPIPPSLRRELVAYFEQHMAPRVKSSPLSGMFGADDIVPRTWALEVCCTCAFAIMPGLRVTVSEQIREQIRTKLAAKDALETSLAELEAEPG